MNAKKKLIIRARTKHGRYADHGVPLITLYHPTGDTYGELWRLPKRHGGGFGVIEGHDTEFARARNGRAVGVRDPQRAEIDLWMHHISKGSPALEYAMRRRWGCLTTEEELT